MAGSDDLFYQLRVNDNEILFYCEYNPILAEKIKSSEVKGTWDIQRKAWVIHKSKVKQLEKIIEEEWGSLTPQPARVLISVKDTRTLSSYDRYWIYGGKFLAWRQDKNFPVELRKGVYLESGVFPKCGGSTKSPRIGTNKVVLKTTLPLELSEILPGVSILEVLNTAGYYNDFLLKKSLKRNLANQDPKTWGKKVARLLRKQGKSITGLSDSLWSRGYKDLGYWLIRYR